MPGAVQVFDVAVPVALMLVEGTLHDSDDVAAEADCALAITGAIASAATAAAIFMRFTIVPLGSDEPGRLTRHKRSRSDYLS